MSNLFDDIQRFGIERPTNSTNRYRLPFSQYIQTKDTILKKYELEWIDPEFDLCQVKKSK